MDPARAPQSGKPNAAYMQTRHELDVAPPKRLFYNDLHRSKEERCNDPVDGVLHKPYKREVRRRMILSARLRKSAAKRVRQPYKATSGGVLLLALALTSAACDSKVLAPDVNTESPEAKEVTVTSPVTPPATPVTPVTPPPTAPVAPPAPTPIVGNPFAGAKFYVKPNSRAAAQASQWRSTRPTDASQMDRIAAQPVAWWLGEWSGDVATEVSEVMSANGSAGTLPVFVVYNIPNRDCGGYSAGGLTAADYSAWVNSIAAAIGSRKAVILLEPDAVPDMDCLTSTGRAERAASLVDAVRTFKARAGISVYIDAGHPGWQDAATIAAWLKESGIAMADGFVLNVSNFATNESNATYGAAISRLIGDKHFVVDTSRNGLGPGSTWCNPTGRALGMSATAATRNPLIDAFYWIKAPGESDGECAGGPPAGDWWASYALGLAQRTTDAMLGK